jgi:hypothetical protein
VKGYVWFSALACDYHKGMVPIKDRDAPLWLRRSWLILPTFLLSWIVCSIKNSRDASPLRRAKTPTKQRPPVFTGINNPEQTFSAYTPHEPKTEGNSQRERTGHRARRGDCCAGE